MMFRFYNNTGKQVHTRTQPDKHHKFTDLDNPLSVALRNDDNQSISKLLNEAPGCSLSPDAFGQTPLHTAVSMVGGWRFYDELVW